MARILIVEDETHQRELYSLELSDDGHEVHTASNGKEAIEKMGKKNYDIVIMDIIMPYFNGIEALEMIYSMKPSQTVIVYTAYSDYRKLPHSLKVNAFLTKSSDLSTLKNKINELALQTNSQIGDGINEAGLTKVDAKAISGKKRRGVS
jgi:DNA-binding NtrC family response regulator